jgi:hypothetical protein
MDYAEHAGGAAFLLYGTPGLVGATVRMEEVGAGVPGCRFASSDLSHDAIGFAVEQIGDFNGDGISCSLFLGAVTWKE